MKLSEAIEVLTSTYQSLDSVASALPVDPKEVNDALNKADPDSVEYVALQVLAKLNAYEKQPTKIEEKKNDNANKDE